MDTTSRIWVEAYGADYGDFLMEIQNMSPEEWEDMKAEVGMAQDDGEYELIQAEDAHLEAMYEDRYEDFASQWDDDPNPYAGTYSED